MATPLPSHGISAQFNGNDFRNAIQFVFEMAAPPDPTRQLTFYFADTVTPGGPSDGEQVPFRTTIEDNLGTSTITVDSVRFNVPLDDAVWKARTVFLSHDDSL